MSLAQDVHKVKMKWLDQEKRSQLLLLSALLGSVRERMVSEGRSQLSYVHTIRASGEGMWGSSLVRVGASSLASASNEGQGHLPPGQEGQGRLSMAL